MRTNLRVRFCYSVFMRLTNDFDLDRSQEQILAVLRKKVVDRALRPFALPPQPLQPHEVQSK
jgi:hypothetical protein